MYSRYYLTTLIVFTSWRTCTLSCARDIPGRKDDVIMLKLPSPKTLYTTFCKNIVHGTVNRGRDLYYLSAF